MSTYPNPGEVWREKSTGVNTAIVSKGRERPWPIGWVQILVTEDGLYWGYESGTARSMRDWFDKFEYVDGLAAHHVLTGLAIVERYEAEGEDCIELRKSLKLPDR